MDPPTEAELRVDEPLGDALGFIALAGGIQLGGFQRIGRRVLSIFHGVVHRRKEQE
jgi:hypothetical protein